MFILPSYLASQIQFMQIQTYGFIVFFPQYFVLKVFFPLTFHNNFTGYFVFHLVPITCLAFVVKMFSPTHTPPSPPPPPPPRHTPPSLLSKFCFWFCVLYAKTRYRYFFFVFVVLYLFILCLLYFLDLSCLSSISVSCYLFLQVSPINSSYHFAKVSPFVPQLCDILVLPYLI